MLLLLFILVTRRQIRLDVRLLSLLKLGPASHSPLLILYLHIRIRLMIQPLHFSSLLLSCHLTHNLATIVNPFLPFALLLIVFVSSIDCRLTSIIIESNHQPRLVQTLLIPILRMVDLLGKSGWLTDTTTTTATPNGVVAGIPIAEELGVVAYVLGFDGGFHERQV